MNNLTATQVMDRQYELRRKAREILREVVNLEAVFQHDAAYMVDSDDMVLRCLFIVNPSIDHAAAGNAKYIGCTVPAPYEEAAIRHQAEDMKAQIQLFREGKY